MVFAGEKIIGNGSFGVIYQVNFHSRFFLGEEEGGYFHVNGGKKTVESF